MSAPHGVDRAHRRGGIWSRLREGRFIDDLAWRAAVGAGQHVGVCADCGQQLKPSEPDTANRYRTAYWATCIACGHDVVAYGPPPEPKDPPPERPRATARKHRSTS